MFLKAGGLYFTSQDVDDKLVFLRWQIATESAYRTQMSTLDANMIYQLYSGHPLDTCIVTHSRRAVVVGTHRMISWDHGATEHDLGYPGWKPAGSHTSQYLLSQLQVRLPQGNGCGESTLVLAV